MEKLGYEHYGVQGGDSGALIAAEMGQKAPGRVIGVHVTSQIDGARLGPRRSPRLSSMQRGAWGQRTIRWE